MNQKNKQKDSFNKYIEERLKANPELRKKLKRAEKELEQPESGQCKHTGLDAEGKCSLCKQKLCSHPCHGRWKVSCSFHNFPQDKEEGICSKHKTKLHCLNCLGEKVKDGEK